MENSLNYPFVLAVSSACVGLICRMQDLHRGRLPLVFKFVNDSCNVIVVCSFARLVSCNVVCCWNCFVSCNTVYVFCSCSRVVSCFRHPCY